MDSQIKKIREIIMLCGYTQRNDLEFEKQEIRYLVKLKLEPLKKNAINFILSRKYYGDDSFYFVLNQKRRVGKLINCLNDLLKNEKYMEVIDDKFIHVQIEIDESVCDLDLINIDNFDHIDGLTNIHGVHNGICFVMLNRASADNLILVLKQELEKHIGVTIKSCFKHEDSSDNVDIICCVLDNQSSHV